MSKRDYQNDYPSVTTVLGVLRKPGLENWFKYNTIATITKESAEGKLIGTQIHDCIQQHIETNEVKIETEYPEQVRTALGSFMLFKREHPSILLQKAEMPLTSEVYKFNGTLDCIAKVGDELVLLDWKTSKMKDKEKPDIFDEYRYQVSAYVMAYNEVSKEKVSKAFILSIAKDKIGYNFEEVKMENMLTMFSEVFLQCLSIYNYQRKGKSNG